MASVEFLDEKRSGHPVEVDDDLIKAIDLDRHSTTREIAEKLHVSHTCIENHLKQLGYVQKLDTWVPHELKETHLTQRINSGDLLKKRNENDPFLKQLITGDEKWVVYNNIKRKDRGAGQLMTRSVSQRLGSGPDDAEAIKKHPFFQEINWDDLFMKKLTPPYVPILTSYEDVSYFDSEYTSLSPFDSFDDSTLSSNDPFEGFSYESDSTNKFAVSNVLNTLGCDFSFDESFSPEAYSSSVLETSMQQEQQVPVILNDSDLSRIPASSLYIHPQSNLSPLEYFRLKDAEFCRT
ncbi:histone-lysine N-methyltransferase SETMAR [Trichonephila clavipes]|nr:histone-lysine N-methyltransferase SETMAR [Trichonephila clavipes]